MVRKIEQEIIEFICNMSGYEKKKITHDTRLLHDIGMDGDDSWEFFEEFHKQFGVDLSNLQYDRHFGYEGMRLLDPFRILIRLLFTMLFWFFSLVRPEFKTQIEIFKPDAVYEPVTILDLVDAAKAGKWVMYYPPKLKD